MEPLPRSQDKIRRLDPSKVPAGMDPSTTYKLKLRIASQRQNPRSDVSDTYIAVEYVDSDRTNYLYHKYPAKKTYVALRTDQDMMDMFASFSDTKYVEIRAWCSPKNDGPAVPFLVGQSSISTPSVPATPSLQAPSQGLYGQDVPE
ncbi:hypothetical protein EJB05_56468, partial [Eragrostis curvula]